MKVPTSLAEPKAAQSAAIVYPGFPGRDRVLLALSGAATIAAGLLIWVFEIVEQPIPLPFPTYPACPGPATPLLIPWFILVVVWLGYALCLLFPHSLFGQRWRVASLGAKARAAFMTGLGVTLAIQISQDWNSCWPLSVIAIGCLGFLLLHLFFGHRGTGIRPTIRTSLWVVLLFHSTAALRSLSNHIDFLTASWRAQIPVLAYSTLLVLLLLAPCISLVAAARRRMPQLWSWLERLPAPLLWLSVLLGAFATGLSHWPAGNRYQVDVVLRALWIGAILSLLLLADRPAESTAKARRKEVLIGGAGVLGAVVIAISVLYLLASYQTIRNTLYDVTPDGYAYLSIARQYGEGTPVVRGVWSPLLSWLAAPGVAMGMDAVLSMRLVQASIGLAWVFLALSLARQWGLSKGMQSAVVLVLLPLAWTLAFQPMTPDLLGGVILLLYFRHLARSDLLNRPLRYGILFGLFGALAYLAKAFNLGFVALHFLLTVWWKRPQGSPPRKARLLASSFLITLVVLCLPWVLALSQRYGRLTVSNSGAINQAIWGPWGGAHYPCYKDQLCLFAKDVDFSWEDPPLHSYEEFAWSPLVSPEDFRYLIGLVAWGTERILRYQVLIYGTLPLLAVVATAVGALAGWSSAAAASPKTWAVVATVLFFAGYAALGGVDPRYLYGVLALPLVIEFSLFDSLVRRNKPDSTSRGTTRHLLAGGCLVALAVSSLFDPTSFTLGLATRAGGCEKRAAEEIRFALLEPFAAVDFEIHSLAFYSRARSVGSLPASIRPFEADQQLHQFSVRSLLSPRDLPLTDTLIREFGYHSVLDVNLCGETYILLRTPVPAGEDSG